MRRLASVILLAPAYLAAACSSPTGDDDWQRVVGTIDPLLSSVQLVFIPEGITAGQPFTVTVTTVGSSSCTRAAGADLAVSGGSATITPYDEIRTGSDLACTDDLRPFPRDITLTLPSAGTAEIRIHGRDFRSDETVTYGVVVTVLP
jgi:hypothetical protein